MSNHNANQCQRCGTCCEKGGPGLHLQDRDLVDSGRIPLRCLFTLRRGELARDNVKGRLVPLAQEIIKIKGQPGRWTCLFYHKKTRGCGIYEHRPLECRALNCRDTRRIEAVYDTARLTRRDLLAGVDGLWDLVEDHEQRCSYGGLKSLVGDGSRGDRPGQEAAILEILRYDAHVRQLTVEKGGMDERMLDFLFGRPLAESIKMFGIALKKESGTYRLVFGSSMSGR
ncbi:zinc/iron-chelating domain-containing protein [Desulfosarcina alkanivorans]|uniref:Zinc/iron-chelating domain-containing protein n=1 Tax=Desulfosarcina alkanivorans TaxID=571177 RepID=A0A5K7YP03_9BACT|nr:YkgJ family cysteine cluster protein [Desulfosarcina alkanivorans]BBO71512.1 zinc/iron-chelating domain-containing protein [Desulfosarcina alkanivorans]